MSEHFHQQFLRQEVLRHNFLRQIFRRETFLRDKVRRQTFLPQTFSPHTFLRRMFLCQILLRRKYYARRAGGLLAAFFLFVAAPLDAYQTPLDAKALHDAFVLGQRNDQSTGDFLAPYLKEMNEGRSDLHVAEIEILTPFAQVVDDSRKNTAGYTEAQATQKYQQTGNTILVNVTLMLPSVYPQAANNNGKDSPAPDSNSPPNSSVAANPTAAANAARDATSEPPSGASAGTSPRQSTDIPGKPPGGEAAAQPQGNGTLRPENFWQSFQFYFKQNGKNIPSKALHDKPIYSTATKGTPAVLDGAAVWLEFDAKDVASQETVIEVTTPDGKTISATFDLKKLR